MATTREDVANMALGHLRQRSIKTFDDFSIEATKVRQFYQQAVDGTLRSFDWPFARVYADAVPTNPNVTLPGWRYSFAYPADCLAIRELARPRELGPIKRYHIASYQGATLVFANEPAIVLRYTARPTTPVRFDAEFVLSLSYHLAMLLAMPLTGKIELTDNMRKLAAGSFSQSEADAGNEDTNDVGEDPVPDWLAARGVPSLTRQERAYGYSSGDQPPGLYALPGSLTPNTTPVMVTTLPDQILPPYLPGPGSGGGNGEPVNVSLDGGVFGGDQQPASPGGGTATDPVNVYLDGGVFGTTPQPTT